MAVSGSDLFKIAHMNNDDDDNDNSDDDGDDDDDDLDLYHGVDDNIDVIV